MINDLGLKDELQRKTDKTVPAFGGGLLLQQLGADFQDSYTKAHWLLCKTQQLQLHLATLLSTVKLSCKFDHLKQVMS